MKITSDSHLDHGITEAQKEYLATRFDGVHPPTPQATIIIGVVLPPELGEVPCGLYGPLMGDEPIIETSVTRKPRGDRAYPSRLVSMPTRPTRKLTVIMGAHKEEKCILYTAFGGPLTPKEPGDPTLDAASREKSEAFWAEHALAEPSLVDEVPRG